MSLRCKLGIHAWKDVGFVGLLPPSGLRECQRCGIGEALMWCATIVYTKEQMAEGRREAEEREKKRLAKMGVS